MSDMSWALQVMIKYNLIVDFSRKTIECPGFDYIWKWSDDFSFYSSLQFAIRQIEQSS